MACCRLSSSNLPKLPVWNSENKMIFYTLQKVKKNIAHGDISRVGLINYSLALLQALSKRGYILFEGGR